MSVLHLLFAALLVLGNGFFVGAEFALVSVRRSQVEPLAAQGSGRARQVLRGLENLPRIMAAAQFGITVCSLTLGAVAEPTLAHLLEPCFAAVRLPEALVHPVGYALALAVVVFFHLVIGEMVPKNLAMAAPERAALWFGPALVAFARLTRPVTAALGWCARLILRLFKVEPKDEVAAVFTGEQLGRLVEDSRQAGLLGHTERERLADALELGSRPVTDVLLGPGDLVTVEAAVTPRQVEELTVATGYSRFPVLSAGGGFLGYLHVKDVLDLEEHDRAVPQHLWRPMTVLRAELPLDEALGVLRADASHLAAVADAAGRVLGLVALEDVLEKLVGEVHDPAHADHRPAGRAGAYESAVDESRAYEGAAYEAGAYEGAAYEAGAYEGAAYEAGAYEGTAYEPVGAPRESAEVRERPGPARPALSPAGEGGQDGGPPGRARTAPRRTPA